MNEDQNPANTPPARCGLVRRNPAYQNNPEEFDKQLMKAARALSGLPVHENPDLQKQQDDFDESAIFP